MDRTLFDFNKKDKLKEFVFDSPKHITIEGIEYKKRLKITRTTKGKTIKKRKLVYVLIKEIEYGDLEETIVSDIECKTEQEAVDWFNFEKELILGCIENKVVFGGRYFWKYEIKNGKIKLKEKSWWMKF